MKDIKIDYYQKFRNSSLDTSAVGLTAGSEYSYYSATPENARVIAWTDNYGIHFCRKEDSEAKTPGAATVYMTDYTEFHHVISIRP